MQMERATIKIFPIGFNKFCQKMQINSCALLREQGTRVYSLVVSVPSAKWKSLGLLVTWRFKDSVVDHDAPWVVFSLLTKVVFLFSISFSHKNTLFWARSWKLQPDSLQKPFFSVSSQFFSAIWLDLIQFYILLNCNYWIWPFLNLISNWFLIMGWWYVNKYAWGDWTFRCCSFFPEQGHH